MGLSGVLDLLFGERGGLRETVEVFRANAENDAARAAARSEATLSQFAAEFALARRGRFDRAIDGLNRLPRPAMAMGTLALFGVAMVDPVWFAARMQGLALVPEPLWWLLGAVVSFYFGARHQAKSQEFQRSIAATLARAPQVADGIAGLRALEARDARPAGGAGEGPGTAAPRGEDDAPARAAHRAGAAPNPALEEWRRAHDRG